MHCVVGERQLSDGDRFVGVTLRSSPHKVLASDFHAKVTSIRKLLAREPRAAYASGTFSATDQRTAEPSREPGCSGT